MIAAPMLLDALIYIKNKIDPTLDLPPLLPRRRVRFLRDECRRQQHAGLHQGHGRSEGAIRVSPLPHMPVVKDLVPGSHQFLCAISVDRALAAGRYARAGKGTSANAGRSRKARRRLRVHSVRLLHDVLPVLLVERRSLSRAGRAAAGAPLDGR